MQADNLYATQSVPVDDFVDDRKSLKIMQNEQKDHDFKTWKIRTIYYIKFMILPFILFSLLDFFSGTLFVTSNILCPRYSFIFKFQQSGLIGREQWTCYAMKHSPSYPYIFIFAIFTIFTVQIANIALARCAYLHLHSIKVNILHI